MKLVLLLACIPAWPQALPFPGPGITTAPNNLAVVNTARGQDASGGASTTIASAAASHTTGNLIVAGVRSSAGGAMTCADTAGNTYVSLTHYNQAISGDWQFCYAKNITGNASNVVTATMTSSAYRAIIVHQVSGASTTSPFDAASEVGGGAAGAGSPQTYTSPSFNTANANSIIFFGANVGALSEVWTAGNIGGSAATMLTSGVTDPIAAVEYRIVSSIQTGITATIQVSAAASGTYSIAAFH